MVSALASSEVKGMMGGRDRRGRPQQTLERVRRLSRTGAARLRRCDQPFCRRFGILVYHRVATPLIDPWNLAVTPENFEGQLASLGGSATFVRLDAELERSRLTRIGRSDQRIAITFDDGYADNLHAALPILERHDVPATIFVATAFLDRPNFWWDRLAALTLSLSAPTTSQAKSTLVGLELTHDHQRLHEELYGRLVGCEPSAIEDALDRLSTDLTDIDDLDDARPLSSDELVELAAHPLISIGAHTSTHPHLTWLDRPAARAEILRGNQALDKLIGPGHRPLAYPYGDAGRSTARIARDLGFRHAVTTEPSWARSSDGCRLLPRLHPLDVDGEELLRQLINA